MKRPEKYVFLFYSGHGDQNTGDWQIDTLDNPRGERLSLMELANVWS